MVRRKRQGRLGSAACRAGCAHAFAVRLAQFATQPHALVWIEQGRIGWGAGPTRRQKQ
jgi:hypothetical protein